VLSRRLADEHASPSLTIIHPQVRTMRGFQVLALAFFGTCAGKQLTIPSPRKQGAVDATAREVSQEQTSSH